MSGLYLGHPVPATVEHWYFCCVLGYGVPCVSSLETEDFL